MQANEHRPNPPATLGARMRRALGYLLLTDDCVRGASDEQVAARALGTREAARRKAATRRHAERVLQAQGDCEDRVRILVDSSAAYIRRVTDQQRGRLEHQIVRGATRPLVVDLDDDQAAAVGD